MTPSKQFDKTLGRIHLLNPIRPVGTGVDEGHYIPLCQYHSRPLASELTQKLLENGVHVKTRATRMVVLFQIAFADREAAFRILAEFRDSHSDTKPQRFSRDYDILLLLLPFTLIIACIVALRFGIDTWAPYAVLFTGLSVCLGLARWQYLTQLQSGLRFSIRDIVSGTAVVAVNVALWLAAA
jgi:hypothetical protein